MAVTLTSIATNTGSTVSTVAVTVPVGGVPKSSLIVVCVADSSITGSGSVADTKSNVYSLANSSLNNGLTTNGFGAIFYSFNVKALVSGDTITYTLGHTLSSAAVSVFYANSIWQFADPVDANATSSNGSSTTPSTVTSNPTGSGELFVACVSNTGPSTDTFTQDSTNAAWANFPVRVGNGPTIAGGSVTNNAASGLTYAPVLGTSRPWAAFAAAFIAATPAVTPAPQLGPTLAQ